MPTEDVSPRPMPAKFGFATALILAGFYRLATLWNPVIFLPPAIVFPVAAFGIRKGIAWSGYGGALFLDALVGGLIVGTARFPNPGVTWGALAFILVLAACAGFLLVWAGRSLAGAAVFQFQAGVDSPCRGDPFILGDSAALRNSYWRDGRHALDRRLRARPGSRGVIPIARGPGGISISG